MSDEKFCLKWNDFEHFAAKSFNNLREEKDFFDVTLVSEDQVMLESHKIVLSASSNFFKNILRKHSHNHPLLYLHGVQSESLQLILNYIYQGEVQIYQEQLDQFLAVASDLQIMGLQQSIVNENKNKNHEYNESKSDLKNYLIEDTENVKIFSSENERKIDSLIDNKTGDDTSMTELMEKISQMMDKIDGIYTCKVCHKQAKVKTDLGRHVEQHIEGISLSCEYCNKKFR